MIPQGVQVFVAREQLGYEARSGALFLFFGKRRDALKILFFDGTGLSIFYKQLVRGTFRLRGWPPPPATHVEIDQATLDALLDGIDLGPSSPRPRPVRRVH
jgi:transposase